MFEKNNIVPSEREWLVMETVWNGTDGITSAEIVKDLQDGHGVTERTVRVLLTRLIGKGLLRAERDKQDGRVYHYYAMKDRASCLKAKETQFVDAYYHGSKSGAVMSLIEDTDLSEEQIQELRKLLSKKRRGGG